MIDARGRFVPRLEAQRLPSALLDRFAVSTNSDEADPLLVMLRFVASVVERIRADSVRAIGDPQRMRRLASVF